MIILAIETSCDETACAIVEGRSPTLPVRVLASVVASSEEMHTKTGGIVPEVAAREQLKSIMPVIQQTLAEILNSKSEILNKSQIQNFRISKTDVNRVVDKIDAIAVTVGPGLVGSLLVGVETAKTLAYAWSKPLIPVNHLAAHLYANWVNEIEGILRLPGSSHLTRRAQDDKLALKSLASLSNNADHVPEFPAVGLVVSGGHTDLVLMNSHTDWEFLGGTRDDAAGECLDKCARLLGLPYSGGAAIEKLSQQILNSKSEIRNKFKVINSKFKITLPRPLLHEETWDFSFSGLKAAFAREVTKLRSYESTNLENKKRLIAKLAYELQEAVVEVLVAKLERAVKEFRPKSVLLGGGVSANLRLREELASKISGYQDIKLFIPPVQLCTDNAVMIGTAVLFRSEELLKGKLLSKYSWKNIQVDPGLEIV